LVAKNVEPIGHAPTTEVGCTADDDASRFATGVRVYDGNASHADVWSFFVRIRALRWAEDENEEEDECPFALMLDREGTLGRVAMPP
jgi:hypothetical protein